MGIPIQLVDLDVPFAWEIPALLDPARCSELVGAATDWVAGTVNGREGRVVRPELRDADVCHWRDPALAAELFERAAPHLPARMRGGALVGLRPAIRIYRYRPGQFFAPHRDQKYREDSLVSHLGLLVYLDRVEEGGATRFLEEGLRVEPRPGLGVAFQNATLHSGEEVVRGQKHVLRVDVMYRDQDER